MFVPQGLQGTELSTKNETLEATVPYSTLSNLKTLGGGYRGA